MAMNVLSIAALLEQCTANVELAPGKVIRVRPLSLEEMVSLLVRNQSVFLAMYSSAMTASGSELNLGPVLLAAPEMVARVIALASEQENTDEAALVIQRQMPAAVQLIALKTIWDLSVPEPKKTFELLSGVMAQLKRLAPARQQESANPQMISATS